MPGVNVMRLPIGAAVGVFCVGLGATIATALPCQAQYGGFPNFGFHSYCNNSSRSGGGIGGCSSNNSFNSGLGSYTQASNGAVYSTQRSTQAAESLARQVTSIWSKMPITQAFNQPAQGMAQAQTNLSAPAPTMNGLLPPMSKKEMLRIFLEGGTPEMGAMNNSPAPDAGSSNKTSTAYSNYQTATNESQKALNAANRVRGYDRDTWSRKNDASQAEYAANNANYAAQRAESAAYNGDSQARGYANLAREAANRARGYANQARYNADTMH
jgi:hypothetical protein